MPNIRELDMSSYIIIEALTAVWKFSLMVVLRLVWHEENFGIFELHYST